MGYISQCYVVSGCPCHFVISGTPIIRQLDSRVCSRLMPDLAEILSFADFQALFGYCIGPAQIKWGKIDCVCEFSGVCFSLTNLINIFCTPRQLLFWDNFYFFPRKIFLIIDKSFAKKPDFFTISKFCHKFSWFN